jgi:rubrerythrin
MVDIMTALATASQAIKLAQDLRGIDKAMDAAEYKLKIADLTAALSDIKMALTDAKEELASKDAEIGRLKTQFKQSADTVEKHGFKYKKGADGEPRGSAYCPVCEQKSGHFFHLTRIAGKDICPNCKAVFRMTPDYVDE